MQTGNVRLGMNALVANSLNHLVFDDNDFAGKVQMMFVCFFFLTYKLTVQSIVRINHVSDLFNQIILESMLGLKNNRSNFGPRMVQ